jgi:hypothetical protein
MQINNTARKFGVQSAFVVAVMAAGIVPAMAAVDVGVTTALGDAKTDVATIGGLVLVVIIAAAAFKYLRRAL